MHFKIFRQPQTKQGNGQLPILDPTKLFTQLVIWSTLNKMLRIFRKYKVKTQSYIGSEKHQNLNYLPMAILAGLHQSCLFTKQNTLLHMSLTKWKRHITFTSLLNMDIPVLKKKKKRKKRIMPHPALCLTHIWLL